MKEVGKLSLPVWVVTQFELMEERKDPSKFDWALDKVAVGKAIEYEEAAGKAIVCEEEIELSPDTEIERVLGEAAEFGLPQEYTQLVEEEVHTLLVELLFELLEVEPHKFVEVEAHMLPVEILSES